MRSLLLWVWQLAAGIEHQWANDVTLRHVSTALATLASTGATASTFWLSSLF